MKNKKGKKGTKVGHVKPTNMGLEGFLDWVNLSIGKTQGNGYVPKIASEPARRVSSTCLVLLSDLPRGCAIEL